MRLTNPIYALIGTSSGRSSSLKNHLLFWSQIIFYLSICAEASPDATDESAALAKVPRDIVPSTIVAKFLQLTFLQNLVVDSNGDIIISSVSDGRIWRVSPQGATKVVGQIPGQAFSVAEAPDNGFVVIGLKLDGVVAVFHVLESGEVKTLMDIKDAIFPNGLESLDGGLYLFADSVRGIIWEVNYWKKSSRIYLQHELLTPTPGNWIPSANGVRIFNDKLFISNTNRKLFLSIQLCDNKPILDTLKIVKENIFVDDFDFDETGNVYITTHPMNVVMRLTPNGTTSVIAGPEESVIGNTACRFGRKPGDEKSLYVVIDGGMFNPSVFGLKPAGLIRLEIDTKGAAGGQKMTVGCAEKKWQHEEH